MGTVHLKRHHMPRDFQLRKRSDVDSQSSPVGMLTPSWIDSNQVKMLSTVHMSAMAEVQHRGSPRVSKLECVITHNDNMKAVDLGDQLAKFLGHRMEQVDFWLNLAMAFIDHFLPDVEPYSTRWRPSTLLAFQIPGQDTPCGEGNTRKKVQEVFLVL